MEKKKEVRMYKDMYEHVEDADISQYELPYSFCGGAVVEEFRPVEDPDYFVYGEDRMEVDGKEYVRVWWGEEEKSYLPVNCLNDVVYAVYIYTGKAYKSDGKIYRTREEAEKAAEEYLHP